MTRIRTLTVSSALCAALLVIPASTMAASAAGKATLQKAAKKAKQTKAAKAAAKQSVVYGTLETLTDTSATVTPPSGAAVTATLRAGTRYVGHTQAAAKAGLKTGEQVELLGRYSNGFIASAVVYDTTPFALPGAATLAGKFSSLANNTLTLTTAAGQTASVQITSQTRFVVNGKKQAAAPSFTANEQVRVAASRLTDGTVAARIVASGKLAKAAAKAVRLAGAITGAPTATGFTVTTKAGKTVNVTIDANTKFRVNGQPAATAPTFATGQQVTVAGQRQTDGTVLAKTIATKTA
jgi:hypothetical protein